MSAQSRSPSGVLISADQIDNYDGDGLARLIKQHDIRNPETNNEVLPPIPFNLMFKSTVGPSAAAPVYLRPETAQGQFLNFKKLLDYNQGAMPFASASVGRSYRNEISPRSGLLRVREFLMAEIEHYVDPEKKRHQRFSEVGDLILPLLDSETQLAGRNTPKNMTIKEAVTTRFVDNETLGYFLGRIMLFLLRIGIDPAKVRFRQHLSNEMAHYACDCWDAELLTSYGWIECVGCADRSAYDLTVHSKRTGTPLVVRETLPQPVEVTEWQATLTKSLAGPRFKRDAKTIQAALDSLDQSTLATLADELTERKAVTVTTAPLSDGSTTTSLPASLVSITKTTRLRTTRSYTPNVIEPSFGIGRLLYALLEHVYWHRPDAPSRAVLSLPVPLAPVKVLIVPLSSSPHPQLTPLARALSARLRRLGIANNIDASSASIGRRYARNDELGTPFGVTVDFGSVEDGSVTLRERDSMVQVRGSEEEVVAAVRNLVGGVETWEEVMSRLALVKREEE